MKKTTKKTLKPERVINTRTVLLSLASSSYAIADALKRLAAAQASKPRSARRVLEPVKGARHAA